MSSSENQPATIEQAVSQFIDAGIGLAMLPFSLVSKSFNTTKEQTSSQFASLQSRGEELDAKIREQLNPSKLCNKLMSAISPTSKREQKIEQLSAKVDTLVELVATLAAKQAADKAPTKSATSGAKSEGADKPATTRKRATRTTSATKAAAPKTTKTRTPRTTAKKDA